jgi:hypothetical protein
MVFIVNPIVSMLHKAGLHASRGVTTQKSKKTKDREQESEIHSMGIVPNKNKGSR